MSVILSVKLQDLMTKDPNAILFGIEGINPKCPNCNDAQVLSVFVPKNTYASPVGFGKMRFIEGKGWMNGEMIYDFCPVCKNGTMRDYYIKNCGLSDKELETNLMEFRVKENPLKRAAYQEALSIVGMGFYPRGLVIFHGDYGVGKSHLLKSIVAEFAKTGVEAIYLTMAEMISQIRAAHDIGFSEPAKLIRRFSQRKVLAIDEIDKVSLTDWTKQTIFEIVDNRYRAMDDILTVFASNTKPSDLTGDLGYFGSRLSAGKVVEVGGPDMREGIGYSKVRLDLE